MKGGSVYGQDIVGSFLLFFVSILLSIMADNPLTMNNIENIPNEENEVSDTYLLQNINISGCSLVDTLEKNMEILQMEACQVKNIECRLETKLRYFNELSRDLTYKLQSLVSLSDLGIGDKEKIKNFVERITLSWLHVNKHAVKKYAGIRVESRTVAGMPLTHLLSRIKKEAASVKVSLQIGSVIYDQDYVSRGYNIYQEISLILDSLERCDDKVQQCLVICKTSPHLAELSTAVDEFVANTELLPSTNTLNDSKENLDAFVFLSKLLTGELLAEEPVDSIRVLAENAPRKPVFITLNTRKKNAINLRSSSTRS